MAYPYPPGEENKSQIDLKREEELVRFMKNPAVPDLSKLKGAASVYKFKHFDDPRRHTTEQLQAANSFIKGTGRNTTVEWRYPHSTRRIFGQVNPGEAERRARKTAERKATRAEVQLLCKYMLFKKGKFTPGKMV